MSECVYEKIPGIQLLPCPASLFLPDRGLYASESLPLSIRKAGPMWLDLTLRCFLQPAARSDSYPIQDLVRLGC